jgi:hypothetical protein
MVARNQRREDWEKGVAAALGGDFASERRVCMHTRHWADPEPRGSRDRAILTLLGLAGRSGLALS